MVIPMGKRRRKESRFGKWDSVGSHGRRDTKTRSVGLVQGNNDRGRFGSEGQICPTNAVRLADNMRLVFDRSRRGIAFT